MEKQSIPTDGFVFVFDGEAYTLSGDPYPSEDIEQDGIWVSSEFKACCVCLSDPKDAAGNRPLYTVGWEVVTTWLPSAKDWDDGKCDNCCDWHHPSWVW